MSETSCAPRFLSCAAVFPGTIFRKFNHFYAANRVPEIVIEYFFAGRAPQSRQISRFLRAIHAMNAT
jgi:hypothetical protein